MVFLSPLDPLFFVLKVELFARLILALPVLNWCELSFVRPTVTRAGWFLLCAV